jgi:hypothetical protein
VDRGSNNVTFDGNRWMEFSVCAGKQDDDITTLLPSLVQYEASADAVGSRLQEKLRAAPLDILEAAKGLSRHTLVRARKGKRLHPRSLDILRRAAAKRTRVKRQSKNEAALAYELKQNAAYKTSFVHFFASVTGRTCTVRASSVPFVPRTRVGS